MRSLPMGRVTLAFTDVEGSTRLLHELGGAYADALSEHRRVLRSAFAAHGGVEVDTQGDAFFVAFPSADGAVRALVAANAELAGGPIRVRAGIHSGEPELSDEGYVGLDVHLGARIGAAGHGGQIILSSTSAAELGDEFVLAELGEHRLKDFAEPIRLFQVGDAEFPPLKTISNTNLPHPASTFVGRAAEVAALADRIRSGARLVTLTGPGGSGKTRLAIETAHELISHFHGGVFWVGLAPVRDATLVTESIARTLGARDSAAEYIGDRHMLLLLDNFEQVVDAAGEIAKLVERCPNLHVLVTSRELLRVRGEIEAGVSPLDADDAVALFVTRSQLEADEAVGELCAALDNLPLAVELAAARVGVLSPAQILERLAGRLDLFRGARDADPRQQTLRATIDWSHALLPEPEQELFAQLAVFAGGCTLDAAEAILAADLDTLEALVQKSLVRHSGERFWMLETIREYALERLAARDDAALARRRHAEYYLRLAETAAPELERRDQLRWLDALEADYPNIRSALAFADLRPRFARSLTFFWAYRAYLDEGRRIAEDAARYAPDDAELAFTAGLLTVMQGDYEGGRVHAERSRRLALENVDDDGVLVQATNVLSRALLAAGEPELAVGLLDDALERARAASNGRGVAIAHLNLGYIALVGGDLERAERELDEAAAAAAATGDTHAEARALAALASAAVERGRTAGAIGYARRSLELSLELGNAEMIAWPLELAGVALAASDPVDAARLLGAAEQLRDDLGIVLTGLEAEQHARARAALGHAHDDAWEAGRSLPLAVARELVG